MKTDIQTLAAKLLADNRQGPITMNAWTFAKLKADDRVHVKQLPPDESPIRTLVGLEIKIDNDLDDDEIQVPAALRLRG